MTLPIDEVLADVRAALCAAGAAVVVAPPGAGKTTRIPVALLDEPWRNGGRIIVLEPRRLAARAAAQRMAEQFGEPLGRTVGLRARLATRSGPAVSIDVLTEGVFTRMLLDDPELTGVAAIIFDEFHERSLDADLGLALALDARQALRPDLKILVMSATLDCVPVAAVLGGAPVIRSDGRMFPIETRYRSRRSDRIEDDICSAVGDVYRSHAGSILVFLPGQAEIRRVAERLIAADLGGDVDVCPLYGGLPPAEQDRAIRPTKANRRKIVLATSIAETSITIDGVTAVIDSGLSRVAVYEPDVGVTTLSTVRVSRAAADQRRGRAGRTAPGLCIRLWDEPETLGLVAFDTPEILQADLTGLVLDCAEWGVTDARQLTWLDPPGEGRLQAAQRDLQAIAALDHDGRLTPLGRRIRSFPLPPRLARMMIGAAALGVAHRAADIAALMVERGAGGADIDLSERLVRLRADRSPRGKDLRQLAKGWADRAEAVQDIGHAPRSSISDAGLLAHAFPERIAKRRGAPGQFLLANGRAAFVDTRHPLASANFLVVGELQGRAAATRILLAADAREDEIGAIAGDRITQTDTLTFDRDARAVRRVAVRRLDAITLSSEARPVVADAEVAEVLAHALVAEGCGKLPWSPNQRQLRQRAVFAQRAGLPVADVSDAELERVGGAWLAPFLIGKTRADQIAAADLGNALDVLLTFEMRRILDHDVPSHFEAPTGNRFALDYESAGAPVLRVRVQELFGLKVHPTVAAGRRPLTLHLLSPAHRPLQITTDLPGFWAGSWADVRSDMRGQYPKHVWPENPEDAPPTARAKPRNR